MKTKTKMIKKIGAVFAVLLVLVVALIPPASAAELNPDGDEFTETKYPDKITNIYAGMKVYPHFEWSNENYGFRAYLGSNSGDFYGVNSSKDGVIDRYVTAYEPKLIAYHTPTEDPDRLKNDIVIQWRVDYENQPEWFSYDQTAPTKELYRYCEGYVVTVVFYDIDVGEGVNENSFTLFSENYGEITYYGFRIDTTAANWLGYDIKVEGITSVNDEDDIPYPMPVYNGTHWTLYADTVDGYINEHYQNGYNKASSELNKKINEAWQNGYSAGIEASSDFNFYSMITALAVAPVNFVKEAFNFEVFGVNVSSFITMTMTLALVAFVVVIIVRLVK